jgi:hypothetical protein
MKRFASAAVQIRRANACNGVPPAPGKFSVPLVRLVRQGVAIA